jgi:hypothetical protein
MTSKVPSGVARFTVLAEATDSDARYRATLESMSSDQWFRVTVRKPRGRIDRNSFARRADAAGWFATVKIDYGLTEA